MTEEVKRLKDQGNVLFSQKKYSAAESKYSDAIVLDDSNAILYSNRAACRLSMGRYMDALGDALKATEIDPSWPKGWTRCASVFKAMGSHEQCVAMYEQALEAFSRLTAPDLDSKKQCEENLIQARQAAGRPKQLSKDAAVVQRDAGLSMPWVVATEMIPALARDNNTNSSAWILHSANEEFKLGLEAIYALKLQKSSDRRVRYEGKLGGLTHITNAILKDARIFRIEEGDFVVKISDQTKFEGTHWRSWSWGTGPEKVMEDAMQRLQKEEWKSVRPALTTIIRHWIMSGFLSAKVNSNYTLAVELHRNALTVINWGRKVWKDMPKSERGTIFELTFRRGVWNMLLDSLMDLFQHDTSNTQLLENIYEEAEGIIQDIAQNPFAPQDPESPPDTGFVWAFERYIKGNALACKGFYHSYMANFGQEQGPNVVFGHHMSAMISYISAANFYPEDDERHPRYLYCAYQYMEVVNAPTSRVLGVLEKIRLSVPKMMKIWGLGPLMVPLERRAVYAELLKHEERAKTLIAQGSMDIDGPFKWEAVKHSN